MPKRTAPASTPDGAGVRPGRAGRRTRGHDEIFFLTLRHAGWQPGSSPGAGSLLNHGCRQATTVAWLGIVGY